MSFHLNVEHLSRAPRVAARKKLGIPFVEVGASALAVASVLWVLYCAAPSLW